MLKVCAIAHLLEKVGNSRHKGVTKMLKVCAIPHHFYEDIGGIAFPTDVCDGDATIFNPFLSDVSAVFDVAITLCGQIVAPLYTCVVVVVKWGGHSSIIDGITKGFKLKNYVLDVDCKTGAHIRSVDVGVARTQ